MSRKSITDPSGFRRSSSFPRKLKGNSSILNVRPAKFSGTLTKDFHLWQAPVRGSGGSYEFVYIFVT